MRLLDERREDVLRANADDLAAAEGRLDEGALDRLRLDDRRLEAIADGLRATAALPPIEREVESWQLADGTRVSERRIPVGVVGANFEARPNVAVDVASQVLKSGNAVVLRTGGAALGTVRVLVDEVLRPALDESGLPRRGGRARALARADGSGGARVAAGSDPTRDPARQRRVDGGAGAAGGRERRADARARRGRRRDLRPRSGVGGERWPPSCMRASIGSACATGSTSRSSTAPRRRWCPTLLAACRERGVEVRGTERAAGLDGVLALDRPRGHEWAGEPDRVATVTLDLVDGLDEAVRIANEETSGLAAAIVTEDEEAARSFLDAYRGTAAFWNATTRLTDGFKLLGTPETGIGVGWAPGPRGPVTYRDLCIRQYRVVA